MGWDMPRDSRLVILIENSDNDRCKRALLWLGLVGCEAASLEGWKKGMDNCLSLERPIYMARLCLQMNDKIWNVWGHYRGIQVTPNHN